MFCIGLHLDFTVLTIKNIFIFEKDLNVLKLVVREMFLQTVGLAMNQRMLLNQFDKIQV
jgi:hypothetical protein